MRVEDGAVVECCWNTYSFVGGAGAAGNSLVVTNGGSVVAKNGPLYVGFGYGDGDYHEWAGLDETWRVAGAFSFGDFKIVGQYDYQDSLTSNDYDAWMVGGSFNMGAMTFKANYMEGDYELLGNDPEQFNIGLDYSMSKRTSVYAMYTDGENVVLGGGAGASDRVGSGVSGGDISGLSFGVIHDF
jgi:predicted porin